MAVKIRLTRMGRTNTPFFRVVAMNIRAPAKGRCLERLGWYDPKGKDRFELNMDRIDYWLGHGAQVSPTVDSLIKKWKKRAPAAAPEPAVNDTSEAERESAPASPVKIVDFATEGKPPAEEPGQPSAQA